nr:hypothetical protein BgiMline_020457 [Biomphalaria glabrata]
MDLRRRPTSCVSKRRSSSWTGGGGLRHVSAREGLHHGLEDEAYVMCQQEKVFIMDLRRRPTSCVSKRRSSSWT